MKEIPQSLLSVARVQNSMGTDSAGEIVNLSE